MYDYFHLGVLYYEMKDWKKASESFKMQVKQYDFAEIHYYRAMVAFEMGKWDDAEELMKKSLSEYKAGNFMNNAYVCHTDKVFLKTIEKELEILLDSKN